MGTLLREHKHADFQTVREIREAYGKAFYDRFASIRDCVWDRSIDHLSAVRNILVHKGGKADKNFVSDISGCAHFAAVKVNDPVVLSAQVVSDLVCPVVRKAKSLIGSVDFWVTYAIEEHERQKKTKDAGNT